MEPRWLTEKQKAYCEALQPGHREIYMWHLNSCNISEKLESMFKDVYGSNWLYYFCHSGCSIVPDFGQKNLEKELRESERNRLVAYRAVFGRDIGDK